MTQRCLHRLLAAPASVRLPGALALSLYIALWTTPLPAAGGLFRRGDANESGTIESSDSLSLLRCPFTNAGMCPRCDAATGSWTQIQAFGPDTQRGAAMAYDGTRNKRVLVIGLLAQATIHTYEWGRCRVGAAVPRREPRAARRRDDRLRLAPGQGDAGQRLPSSSYGTSSRPSPTTARGGRGSRPTARRRVPRRGWPTTPTARSWSTSAAPTTTSSWGATRGSSGLRRRREENAMALDSRSFGPSLFVHPASGGARLLLGAEPLGGKPARNRRLARR